MSEPIEIAVFDLAGTTVKETGLVESALRSVTGDAFEPAVFHASRGGSKRAMLARLLGEVEADNALLRFDDAVISGVRDGLLTPLPHAEQAFSSLRTAGIKVVLITGFSRSVQDALLEQLEWRGLVDLAVSPDEHVRGRPYPDLILSAGLTLHVTDVSAVAVVGDTSNDVLAARRAGAGIAAAVLTGAHDGHELAGAAPTHLLEHVGQFADLILRARRG